MNPDLSFKGNEIDLVCKISAYFQKFLYNYVARRLYEKASNATFFKI